MTKRIKEIRLAKGMTLLQVAKALDVSEATAQRYESGEIRNLKYDTIVGLADLFKVSPAYLMGWDDDIDDPDLILPSARSLPIAGTICAGDGVICMDNLQGRFIMDIKVDADFCLLVKGDSMKDAEIYDHDYIFVKKNMDFVDGDIYAIELLDVAEAVIRVVHRMETGLLLSPCNPEYAPKVVALNDARVIGKVVGVYHGR